MTLFEDDADYKAFESIIRETLETRPMRVCAYCLMPNHWHMVLWPEKDGQLATFMQRLTITHAARWQRSRDCVGSGHVYQGRFKSFPIEDDEHFYNVARYVERNPLKAGLCDKPDAWRWSSLWLSEHGDDSEKRLLSAWPIPRPHRWREHVEQSLTEAEEEAIGRSLTRGTPLGGPEWAQEIAEKLGLASTLRAKGRPKRFQEGR